VTDRLEALGVEMVKADMTSDTSPLTQAIKKDLSRMNRSQIPVMMMYPANYPKEPAILMEGLIFANDVLKALDAVEPAKTTAAKPQAIKPVAIR